MKNPLERTSSTLHNKLQRIWILITAVLLCIALYVNWHVNQHRSYNKISKLTVRTSNKLDRFIEDLFQDIYTIPFYEKKISNCKTNLYPYLEHINLNNPKISGLIVSYDNQNICSTLTDDSRLQVSTNQPRSILGPYKLAVFDEPVFMVQQKIGHYSIGLLVINSIFKKLLQPTTDYSNKIAIFDEVKHKFLFQIQYNKEQSQWVIPADSVKKDFNPHDLYAFYHLHSISTLKVLVYQNRDAYIRNLWYCQLLIIPFIIFLSYLMYLVASTMITKHYSLLSAMKLAIKNKEFYPEYQPVFNAQTHQYNGAEVLLRWQNKEDKIIMPDFFIREAELTGIIIPITLQIIEIVFKESKIILDKNPQFHLAFNLSALHFIDSQFFNTFYNLIEQYHISTHQILLEITERDLLDINNSIFIKKMQELRQKGFSLAVDDFGTGHASINYLQSFPFNYLKIDKLFIQAIGTKAITESLNDAIINMANKLKLIIIAEGVETKEQHQYLTEHGVQLQQGWYFSRALTFEQLFNLIGGDKDDSLP